MSDAVDKYRIDSIISTTPNAFNDLTRWVLLVTAKSTGLQEEGQLLAKPATQYAVGQTFYATRQVNSYGLQLKKAQDPNAPAGPRGNFGGGAGKSGGSYGRTPPAGVPYVEAIALYRKIATDLGVAPAHEWATSMMIAIFRGDVLRPGQAAATVQPQQAAPPQAQAPAPAPSGTDGW